ncbi:MAG: hypothetical protein J1E42_08205 [Akkermansiaceae bacterium]|nr:hypothetical protein [Akkermansiaceae bacterium]
MKRFFLSLIAVIVAGCCSVPKAELALFQAKMARVGLYQESPCSDYGQRYLAYMAECRQAYDAELKKDPDFENKLRAEFLKPIEDDNGEGGYPVSKHDDVFFERHKDDPQVRARYYYIYFYYNDGERGFYSIRTFPWLQYSSAFTVEEYEEALKYHLLSYNDGRSPEHVMTYQECLAEKRQQDTPEYVHKMNQTFNAPWVSVTD